MDEAVVGEEAMVRAGDLMKAGVGDPATRARRRPHGTRISFALRPATSRSRKMSGRAATRT